MRLFLCLCALMVPLAFVAGCDNNPQGGGKVSGVQAGGKAETPPESHTTFKVGNQTRQKGNP